MELANLGENPVLSSREPGVPVGLKVLFLFLQVLKSSRLKLPRILVPHAMPTRHCRSCQFESLSCSSELKANPRCGSALLLSALVCMVANHQRLSLRRSTRLLFIFLELCIVHDILLGLPDISAASDVCGFTRRQPKSI